MTASAYPADLRQLPALLRGEPSSLRGWLEAGGLARWVLCFVTIVVGAGLFGAAVGCWRSGTQALYTAIKLPLILLLTAGGNALLNGLLAPLLGLNITLRQATLAVLLSFTLAAVIPGSLAPLLAFLVWNLPPMVDGLARNRPAFMALQLISVGAVAFAGTAAHVRLLQLLQALAGSRGVARRLLGAWLAANLLLGAQFAWIARPFFGQPDLPVEFLRPEALAGNFFEAIAYNAWHLLDH